MKKQICKLLSMLLVLALLCGNSIYAADAGNRYSLNVSTPLTASQIAKENAASTAYSNLITAFYEGYIGHKTSDQNTETAEFADVSVPTTYTVNGIPAEGYPEYYAGAYINANYELVILVTDKSASTKKALCDQAKDTSVVFQEASYSYPELISCMNDITCHWRAGDEQFQPIKFAFIDDHGNRVVVGCTQLNAEYISFLRESLPGFNVITFVDCEDFGKEVISLESTVNGYTALCSYQSSVVPSSVGSLPMFSYGCKAKKTVNGTTKYGFITAGHAVSVGEYVFPTPPSLNAAIGVCTASINQPSLGVDAAFVERTNSSYTLSNVIPSRPSYTLSTSYSSAAQGAAIYKCGSQTQESPGQVAIASFTVNVGGTYFYQDMVVATYNSVSGDSGSLVYSLNTSTHVATPLGIHVLSISPSTLQGWNMSPPYNPNSNDGYYKIYCKMGYVLSYLGVSLSS